MRLRIKQIPFEIIQKADFHPEPHTVDLSHDKENSEWWGMFDEAGNILCVICIVCRPKEVHFARTYTPPEFRKQGYCTTLLQYLSFRIYPTQKLTAHCLPASVNCYSKAGFKLKTIKEFKYSVMYYMEREERKK